jgi:hypothetical protein
VRAVRRRQAAPVRARPRPTSGPLNRRDASTRWSSAAPARPASPRHPHMLRHTFATSLLRSEGFNLREVQAACCATRTCARPSIYTHVRRRARAKLRGRTLTAAFAKAESGRLPSVSVKWLAWQFRTASDSRRPIVLRAPPRRTAAGRPERTRAPRAAEGGRTRACSNGSSLSKTSTTSGGSSPPPSTASSATPDHARDDQERDELQLEGLVILYELADRFEPHRAGYAQAGRFSGYARLPPEAARRRLAPIHPEHKRITGRRQARLGLPQGNRLARPAAHPHAGRRSGPQAAADEAAFLDAAKWTAVPVAAAA